MYDSIIQHDFDRVSGAFDKDLNEVDTNNIKVTYDDNNTNTDSVKEDKNIIDDIGNDNDNETQDDTQMIEMTINCHMPNGPQRHMKMRMHI